MVRSGDNLSFNWHGSPLSLVDKTFSVATKAAEPTSDGKVRAALNARVVRLEVAVGDKVVLGQVLCTLEAMKMEHIHSAPLAGTIKSVNTDVGLQVAARSILIEIEATKR